MRVVQASSAEIFGAARPLARRTRTTPVRPVNPYGAAKAFAHHMVGVYRHRGLHAVSRDPLQPRVAAPAGPVRHPQDHLGGRRDRRGPRRRLALGNLDARRDWGWAPDYVDAMVLGRARRRRRATTSSRPASATRSRDFVAAAFARAGIDDWEPVRRRSTRSSCGPADPTELVGDATPGADACSAGHRPSSSTRSSAAWSTPTSRTDISSSARAYLCRGADGGQRQDLLAVSGGTGTWEISGWPRPHVVLAVAEQLLVQLLARAQAGVDDLDRRSPACVDQPLGHVGDAHRLAHVEHQRLAVAADGAGLDHELHRLLDGHEVAGDVGVGDGDRAAARRSGPGTR